MPRYLFPAGTVTNTTGGSLGLTFYSTATTGRRETDLWTVDASDALSAPIPNGVVQADASGAYSAFAGPDDVDTLYLLPTNGTTRTMIAGAVIGSQFPPGQAVIQAQRITTSTSLSTALSASSPPPFATASSFGPNDIFVDSRETFQDVLGAGAALTDAAAYNLMTYLTAAQRTSLLTEMFSPSSGNLSLLRIAFGSTDFQQASGYTYDEVPNGSSDSGLSLFSVAQDQVRIIPIIREILAINPAVKVFASVWHPPSWMLRTPAENFTQVACNLNDQWLTTYVSYLVKCIQAYGEYGIPIYAISPGNEWVNGSKFGASVSHQQTVLSALGAALETAGLNTRIVSHDDQWATESSVAEVVLADATTLSYIDGVAFHGYSGEPATALAALRRFDRSLRVYHTEWRSLAAESADTQMRGMAGGYVAEGIGSGASTAMLWNLALDENGGPQDGSHAGRLGVVTVASNGTITRNAGFYALVHLSKYLRTGAKRCLSSGPARGAKYSAYSTYPTTLKHLACVNPDGSVVLYVYNGTGATVSFQIVDARSNRAFPASMSAGDLATFTWGTAGQISPAGIASTSTAPTVTPTVTTSSGTVTLSWSSPVSGAAVTGYQILRDGNKVGTAKSSATSFTEYVAAGTYTYKLVAETGLGSATSAGSTVTVSAAAVPSTPVLSIGANSGGPGFTLTWTASSANGSSLTYTVKRGLSSGAETTIASVAGGVTTFTDVTAPAYTTVYYTITATNTTGTALSNEVSSSFNGSNSWVYVDASSTDTPSASPEASHTWAHTVGASATNRLLVVVIGFPAGSSPEVDPQLSGITYNSVALTKLGRVAGNAGQTTNRVIEVWHLVAPATGTHNIVATLSGGAGSTLATFYPMAVSFGGVNASTPTRTQVGGSGTAGRFTMDATTSGATTDLLLLAAAATTTTSPLIPGPNQIIMKQQGGGTMQAAISLQPGGTGTMESLLSWSGTGVYASLVAALRI